MIFLKDYKPFGFQQETINKAIPFIKDNGGCLILDETGLGKTITSATIAIQFAVQPNILVVSPKNNQKSWAEVLPNAVICTKAKITKGNYEFIIVDEAHNFNNDKNKSYKDLLDVIYYSEQEQFPKILLLTATPVNNNFGELFHMLKLIPFKPNTFYFYLLPIVAVSLLAAEKELKKFEIHNVDKSGMGKGFRKISTHSDLNHSYIGLAKQFAKIFTNISFRTTRKDVFENYSSDMELMGLFPEIFKSSVKLENIQFGNIFNKISQLKFPYQNILMYCDKNNSTGLGGVMRTFLLKRLDSSSAAFKVSISNMLHTLENIEMDGECVHIDGENYGVRNSFFEDVEFDKKLLKEIQNFPLSDEVKLNNLLDQLNTDGKIIIFTEYKKTQQLIYNFLKDKYKCLSFNGDSDEKEMEVVRLEFDPNIKGTNNFQILITTDALAEGVNLHRASKLIHFDLKWNPSRLIQREGRINRINKNGNHTSIEIVFFEVPFLIEEILKLEKKISEKNNLSDILLNRSEKVIFRDLVDGEFYNDKYTEEKLGIIIDGKGVVFNVPYFKSNITIINDTLEGYAKNVQRRFTGLGGLFVRPKNLSLGWDSRISYVPFLKKWGFVGDHFELMQRNHFYGGIIINGNFNSQEWVDKTQKIYNKFFHNVILPKTLSVNCYINEDKENKLTVI